MKRLALVFDTETTGLIHHPLTRDSAQPRIIEFGAAIVECPSGKITEELNLLINPGVPIPELITGITGITDGDVQRCPKFGDAAAEIRGLFAKADLLIAHNLPFDREMVAMELRRLQIDDWPWPKNQICTVQEHAEEWGRRPKLIELYAHYMNWPLAQSHRAIEDVLALVEICVAAGVLS